jgi:XTP/dITP diphosphohydrolase
VAEISRIVLATGNHGKLRDFRFLLRDTGIELSLPIDHGVDLDVEETGTTFQANALLKARAHAELIDLPILADDSGLVVSALDGRPGVYSARYAGEPCDDQANNLKVIDEVQGLADRSAAFVAVLALVLPGGREIVAEGRCEGRIVDDERGTNGFGYDAIFFRDDLGCTFGQATDEQKNARSHRAAAVADLLAQLRALELVV